MQIPKRGRFFGAENGQKQKFETSDELISQRADQTFDLWIESSKVRNFWEIDLFMG